MGKITEIVSELRNIQCGKCGYVHAENGTCPPNLPWEAQWAKIDTRKIVKQQEQQDYADSAMGVGVRCLHCYTDSAVRVAILTTVQRWKCRNCRMEWNTYPEGYLLHAMKNAGKVYAGIVDKLAAQEREHSKCPDCGARESDGGTHKFHSYQPKYTCGHGDHAASIIKRCIEICDSFHDAEFGARDAAEKIREEFENPADPEKPAGK